MWVNTTENINTGIDRFKPGDKVILKSYEEILRIDPCGILSNVGDHQFYNGLKKYFGKAVTINYHLKGKSDKIMIEEFDYCTLHISFVIPIKNKYKRLKETL